MENIEDYDCCSCGACCAFFCHVPEFGRPTVATELKQRDLQRMPERIIKKLVQVDTGSRTHTQRTALLLPARKIEGGAVCSFFKGEVGKTGCSCSIYKFRPYNCRYFVDDFDNPSCRMARSWAGIEPVVKWINPHQLLSATEEQMKRLAPYILEEKELGMLKYETRSGRYRSDFEKEDVADDVFRLEGVCGK